ncbi:MAG: DoxX family protein [Chitinophagaceae bacterium]|nr:DoxX family protein [Chitinophagaceae bacterium]
MKTATLIIRLLAGTFILFFGLNKFFHFVGAEMANPDSVTYFTGLVLTKTVIIVGILEVLAGLSFLANAFVPLFALILLPISFNAILFHATLEPASIGGALLLLILNVFLIVANKDAYKDLLKLR